MSHLFAHLYRLRNIKRWSLMRNLQPENVAEHTLNVALIVHALCSIARDVFGKDVPTEKIVLAACFHDASELFTSDVPTPVKYHNEDILKQFRILEELATARLLNMVPNELLESYRPLIRDVDLEVRRWIKAADLCDAYVKCKSEIAAGNREFASAEKQVRLALYQMDMREVDYFLEHFAPSFEMTLDEISISSNRLTTDMIPEMQAGVYEVNTKNEIIAELHTLNEEGHIMIHKDCTEGPEIIVGVQQFLNERGIRHVVFTRGDYTELHLSE
ncbi:5'-deoxynucleotidase YfbR [Paenibacillus sp. yr247]|uniref:5'-deoxynucleotidase n=1 Tax=Paenibacillus sp. yr247 TaxID=1761880 RepID=UPI0008922A32|nr:5'-deoxynucleotidase YfbR [Paenibacillus sp. yr247]